MIVGLAGFGKSSYERGYNSGIGSNGLTSARHDVLEKYYALHYPESFNPGLNDEVVYIGKHRMTDKVSIEGNDLTIGQLLLSPTRTFAPVIKKILEAQFDAVHGLIHCSRGGQTKCLKYLPGEYRIIKDNLFVPPEIFTIIQQSSGSKSREMYEVFNMGCRLEIYCDEKDAGSMIRTAHEFDIAAQVIGRVEEGTKKELIIRLKEEEIIY